ncbi:MAG: nucleotidyltransferase domain-containing protein [Candidatus Nanoarchaeia archaeon]|nr:nucleotidyltransferase domain-containing protein [Candidatus Nanoarchaeia archaeon]
MGIIKYQKSTLKIWGFLLKEPMRKRSMQEIISLTSTGRTAAFRAVSELKEKGIVEAADKGNQKEVRIIPSLQAFSIRLMEDSEAYKSLDKNAKLAIGVFLECLHTQDAKAVFVFGSVLSGKPYNDIDIAIVYKDKIDRDRILWARTAAEVVSEKPINVHFNNSELNSQLNGICVRGFEYYVSLFTEKRRLFEQYSEALKWIDSASNNIRDKSLFANCLESALLNLAFCFCIMQNIAYSTKNDVLKIFRKNHGNLFKAKGANKMELLKKAAVEIGKTIYS